MIISSKDNNVLSKNLCLLCGTCKGEIKYQSEQLHMVMICGTCLKFTSLKAVFAHENGLKTFRSDTCVKVS